MTTAGCPLCLAEGGLPVWAAAERPGDAAALAAVQAQLLALGEDIRQAMAVFPAVWG